jgi:hypothetical protein
MAQDWIWQDCVSSLESTNNTVRQYVWAARIGGNPGGEVDGGVIQKDDTDGYDGDDVE